MTVEEVAVPGLEMIERYPSTSVDGEPELPGGYCHIRNAIGAVLAWCEVTTEEFARAGCRE